MLHSTYMPKVYSYTRFSTPEQAQGDSFRRQSDAAARWARERGLELDATLSLEDKGVSAYRGGNVEEDRGLGAFLFACRQGLIERGSFLLVESLDRISRMTPRRVQRLVDDIVDAGVTIVTLNDGQEYTQDRLDNDPMALLIALMVSWRAHEESKTKGRRVAAAWAAKRDRVRAGVDPILTRRSPPWLRWSDGQWRVDDAKAAVVRRVYQMTIDGDGEHKIATALNQEGVPPLGRGAMWHRSAVSKLLRTSTVIGTLTPGHMVFDAGKKRRTLEDPIEGAYPAILDRADWLAVRAIKDGSTASVRGRAAKAPLSNIFAGLARCPDCGAVMTRVMKGKKGGSPKLVCTRAKAGAAEHPYVSVDLAVLESAFLSAWQALPATVPAGDAGGTLDATCTGLEAEIDHTIDKLQAMEGQYSRYPSQALAASIQAAEAQLTSLKESLQEAEERRSVVDGGLIHARLGQLHDLLERDVIEREPINAALRSLFDQVTVDHEGGRMSFAWKQGGETTIVYKFPDATHEHAIILTSEALAG
jgi:DNA invertase Pin-like site-specific DNA recombinase